MGVYIKGMKMPESCFYCQFRKKINPEEIMCLATGEIFEETFMATIEMRNANGKCPLVEIPEPHGRLIDADALAQDLEEDVERDQRALDDMDIVGDERTKLQLDKDCKQNCMWYLTESLTVIEAEGSADT